MLVDVSLLTILNVGRRKKKKCDLSKPICLRCRKSIGSVVCEWPAHVPSSSSGDDTHRSRSHTDTYHKEDDSSGSSPIKSESPPETTLVVRRQKASDRRHNAFKSDNSENLSRLPSPRSSIEHKITVKLPAGVNKVAPYVALTFEIIMSSLCTDRRQRSFS